MTRAPRLLVFAQGMDVLTFCLFFVLVQPTFHTERNPLIAIPFALGGFAAVAAMKMSITLVVAYRATQPKVVKPWYSKARAIAISLAIASGVLGAGLNSFALIDTLRVTHGF
jgi:hypothetical protein